MMKIRFLVHCVFSMALLLATVSCKEDMEEFNDGLTRYVVIGKVPGVAANMISSAVVYEYNPSDIRIDSSIIEDPSSGTRYVFVANDETSHLKVRLNSNAGTHRWGDTIIRVIPGGTVEIAISISSPVRMTEPMLSE